MIIIIIIIIIILLLLLPYSYDYHDYYYFYCNYILETYGSRLRLIGLLAAFCYPTFISLLPHILAFSQELCYPNIIIEVQHDKVCSPGQELERVAKGVAAMHLKLKHAIVGGVSEALDHGGWGMDRRWAHPDIDWR